MISKNNFIFILFFVFWGFNNTINANMFIKSLKKIGLAQFQLCFLLQIYEGLFNYFIAKKENISFLDAARAIGPFTIMSNSNVYNNLFKSHNLFHNDVDNVNIGDPVILKAEFQFYANLYNKIKKGFYDVF